MENIARKTTSHPVRLKSPSLVRPVPEALTTAALARPQVHALGIEFHQKDVRFVRFARVGVATRVACHPGIANAVHLRKDRQLSFAVRR